MRSVPWDHLVQHYSRKADERKISVYQFSNRRVFRENEPPGIYDESTDPV